MGILNKAKISKIEWKTALLLIVVLLTIQTAAASCPTEVYVKNHLADQVHVKVYKDRSLIKTLYLDPGENIFVDRVELESDSGVQYYVYWEANDGIVHKTGRYIRGCIYQQQTVSR